MTYMSSSIKDNHEFRSFEEYKDEYYPSNKEIKLEEIKDPKILGKKLAELSMKNAIKKNI